MAKHIDMDNLTVDDLHYLAQRSWLVNEAEAAGYENIRSLVANRDNIVESDLESEEEELEDEEIDYNDLKVEELKAELEKRELPTDGKKPELVARLIENDEEEEEEEN